MIQSIAVRGITIIAIEHLMRVVAALAQRAVVLHHGAVLSDGATQAVFRDPKVVEAYFGNRFAERFART
jgi:branched-chain amino acid transport system ATP-binding protein